MPNRNQKRRIAQIAARVALAAVLCAALCSLAASGLRMQRAFQARDTIAEAQNWLFARFPRGGNIAFDEYLGPATRGVPCESFYAQRLHEFWPGVRRSASLPEPPGSSKIGLYLRNASFPGRLGNRYPASRRLMPEYASNVTAFTRSNVCIASWKPMAPGPRPVFAQHDIELWALRAPAEPNSPWQPAPAANAPVVNLVGPRPISLVESAHAFHGAAASFDYFGAIEGLRIVGKRRKMNPPSGSGVAVFFLASAPAPVTVSTEGYLLSTKIPLLPGEAVIVPISQEKFARAARTNPFPGFRVRMRGDDQNSVCIGFFARDVQEAQRLLRCAGARTIPPAVASVSDTQAGVAETSKLVLSAVSPAESVAAIQSWRDGTGPEPVLPGDIPLHTAEFFARHRIPRFIPYGGNRLPVYLPPGEWNIEVEFLPDTAPFSPETAFFVGQCAPFKRRADSDDRVVYETTLRTRSGMLLETDPDFSPGPSLLATGAIGLEITWSALENHLRQRGL